MKRTIIFMMLIILPSFCFAVDEWKYPNHVYKFDDLVTANVTDEVGNLDSDLTTGVVSRIDGFDGYAYKGSGGGVVWYDGFLDNNQSGAIVFFYNHSTRQNNNFMWFGDDSVDLNRNGWWYGVGATDYFWRITTDSSPEHYCNADQTTVPLNQWVHVGWVYSEGIIKGYINGIKICENNIGMDYIDMDGDYFGILGGDAYSHYGSMDELMIYEEVNLTDSDISNIYNQSLLNNFYPYIVSDTTPPVITITQPQNNSILVGDVSINVTIDENGECYTNNSAFVLTENTTTFFTWLETTLPNENYNIEISCNDTSDNQAFSYLNFTKATPTIDVLSPLDGDTVIGFNITSIFQFQNFNPTVCSLYSNITGDYSEYASYSIGEVNVTSYYYETQYQLLLNSTISVYRFEEGSGTNATDSSINEFHGKIIGATYSGSKGDDNTSSWALDFDGIDDYVNITDRDKLSFTDGASNDKPFTISLWVNLDDSTRARLVHKEDTSITTNPHEYSFTTTASDQLTLIIKQTDNNIRRARTTSETLTSKEGIWTHLTATYDGRGGYNAEDGIQVYINGLNKSTTITSVGTYVGMVNTNQPVRIGWDGGTYRANGRLDEIYIFNKSLTPSEVMNLYKKGINISQDVLVENITTINQTLNQSTNYSLEYFPPVVTETDLSHFINCHDGYDINSTFFTVHYSNDFLSPVISELTINETYNETYNHNIWVNFTTDEFATCTINNTAFSLSYTNGSVHEWGETTLENDFFTIFLNCSDDSIQSNTVYKTLYFTKDIEYPFITLITPVNGSSFANEGIKKFIFNLSDDRDLYSFDINFSYIDFIFGKTTVYKEHKNLTGSGQQAYYNEDIFTGNWTNTTFEVGVKLCDSHTKNDITKAKSVKKQKNHIVWDFEEYWIRVQSMNGCEDKTYSEFYGKKYNFAFEYNCPMPEKKFKITSNKPIDYIKGSGYKGHFVIGNHWVDFQNSELTLVERECSFDSGINGTKCDYFVTVYDPSNMLSFNSVGELNCNMGYFTVTLEGGKAVPRAGLFNLDFSNIATVIVVFIIVILWIGTMFIGFYFRNFGFASFGFFLGLVLGLMFSGIHIFLSFLFLLLNIFIFVKYSSSLK